MADGGAVWWQRRYNEVMKDITFIVREDEVDGGYTASARWPHGNRDIITEGETREEVIANIRQALDAAFDDDEPKPDLIHLHFVRDEVIAR
jgi:predicted RNase H-like HicB family nuclease